VADKVSLPEVPGAVELLANLPEELAALYASPDNLLLPDRLPSSPAFFSVEKGQYAPLLRRMFQAGMLDFTDQPRVVNGMFAVPKGDKLRLIIDCRRLNDMVRDPAPVSLPSPASIANLVYSSPRPVYVAKTDLDSFFYRVRMPQSWWPFFALKPISPAELGVPLPHHLASLPFVYPVLTVLPMGFSHAVLLAQSLHEFVLRRTSLRRFPWLKGSVSVTLRSLVALIYVDDLILLSYSKRLISSVQWEVLRRYDRDHIIWSTKKLVRPTLLATVLGLLFNGALHTYGASPAAAASLAADLRAAAVTDFISPRALSKLVGKFVWVALVRRPALSVLWSVYSFVRSAKPCAQIRPWPSVRQELLVMAGLLPLLFAVFDLPVSQFVGVSDASMHGGAALAAAASRSQAVSLWSLFSSVKTASVLPPLLVSLPAPSRSLPLTSFDASLLASSPPSVSLRSFDFLDALKWRPLRIFPWRFTQHINALEVEAARVGVSALSSVMALSFSRVAWFSDSAVLVAVLNKGRSSSRRLAPICRRHAAFVLGSCLSVVFGWLPSGRNPADAPSRLWDG
jgi:hypothetical protein